MVREVNDVGFSFAKWFEIYVNDAEAEEEVGAEGAICDMLFEGLVGCGHDPNIGV